MWGEDPGRSLGRAEHWVMAPRGRMTARELPPMCYRLVLGDDTVLAGRTAERSAPDATVRRWCPRRSRGLRGYVLAGERARRATVQRSASDGVCSRPTACSASGSSPSRPRIVGAIWVVRTGLRVILACPTPEPATTSGTLVSCAPAPPCSAILPLEFV